MKNRLFKDKHVYVIVIELIVIVLGIVGLTYAANYILEGIGIKATTSNLAIEDIGINVTSSPLVPISDSSITPTGDLSGVLKITFSVKGSNSNTTKNPIYDIALKEISGDCILKNSNVKWNLYKNNELLSSGNMSPEFDKNIVLNDELTLTNTQVDLPSYGSTADSYVFILWLSETCTGDIASCDLSKAVDSSLAGKTISADIDVLLYSGKKKELVRETANVDNACLSGYIGALALGNHTLSEIPSADDSFENGDFIVVHQPATVQMPETYDYRYKGASPANYIWFNCDELDGLGNAYGTDGYNYSDSTCEKWRIIGAMETEQADGSKKYLTKIMRNESVGDLSWDNKSSLGYNDWTDAHLMKTLNPGYETFDIDSDGVYEANSLYWNRQDGTCLSGKSANLEKSCSFVSTGMKENPKKYIEEVKWYLGGSVGEDQVSLIYRKQRREIGGYANPNVIYWFGKVGLIYSDDYGYAAGKTCVDEVIQYDYDLSCYQSDWINNGINNQWTLSVYANLDYYASAFVRTVGDTTDTSVNNEYGIHPVLYLKSTVEKIGGTGTMDDPYIIK